MLLRVVKKGVVLGLLMALAGCTNFQGYDSWSTEIRGIKITYSYSHVVTQLEYGGFAKLRPLGKHCRIYLADYLQHPDNRDLRIWVAAHEVGHCLDYYELQWTHGGIKDGDGCILGDYFCPAQEGYAGFYSYYYIEKCGYVTAPLGIHPDDGVVCEVPDPRTVKEFIQNREFRLWFPWSYE